MTKFFYGVLDLDSKRVILCTQEYSIYANLLALSAIDRLGNLEPVRISSKSPMLTSDCIVIDSIDKVMEMISIYIAGDDLFYRFGLGDCFQFWQAFYKFDFQTCKDILAKTSSSNHCLPYSPIQ